MSKVTGIAWCDSTWNPWSGCLRVSPACDRCYAAATAARFSKAFGSWEPGAPRKRTSEAYWRQPLVWDREASAAGVRRRVFCASMSDVFDNQAPEAWRADLFKLIARCQALDWLLLTKRPQNIRKMLPPDWGNGYPNVWLGCTVENMTEADRRIPLLQAIPARVRFLSVEPLLERVRLDLRGIGWVIVGGESGPGARPMSPDWARSVQAQCREAATAFFFKQRGSNKRDWPVAITSSGHDPAEWPEDLRTQKFPQISAALSSPPGRK